MTPVSGSRAWRLATAATAGAAGVAAAVAAWLGWVPAALSSALAGLGAFAVVAAAIRRSRAGVGASGTATQGLDAARQAVPELVSTAHTLSELSDTIASGARGQASRLMDVATAVKSLSESVAEVARHAEGARSAAEETWTSAEAGWTRASEAGATIRRMVESLDRSATVIQALDQTQERIAGVVTVIRDIANETNLLSLNAAVEAARAGQHGAGFGVVAGEVRNLSHRTKDATSEIAAMVEAVGREIREAVATMRTVAQEVEGGVRLVEEAAGSFEMIRGRAGHVRGMVSEIAQAAGQQSGTTRRIAGAMDDVAAVSRESSRQAGRVSQAGQTLWVLADALKTTLTGGVGAALRRQGRSWMLRLTVMENLSVAAQALLRMADQLEKASDGRLRVERLVSAQGAGERDIFASLRRGENSFGFVTGAVASNYIPALQVLDLPYAFASYADLHRVVDGPLGRRLLDAFRPLGLAPLGFLEIGARHLTCAGRPIRRPEDLEGMVMRVMESNVAKATAGALGATARAMTLPEFRQAISTGTIEAADNTVTVLYRNGMHRHHRHLTLDAHFYTPTLLLFSDSVLKALPADLQRLVTEAAREAIAWQRERTGREEAEALGKLRVEGVQVLELSPQERAAFVRATRSVWDQFQGVIGDDVMQEFEQALGRGSRVPASAPLTPVRSGAPRGAPRNRPN